MQPSDEDGEFPWLKNYFDNIWDGTADENGVGQLEYFLGWLGLRKRKKGSVLAY